MSYDQRINQQIKQYEKDENLHKDLPNVQRYYQINYISKGFKTLFGVDNHFEFYALPFTRAIKETGNSTIISIGSGDGAVELSVAKVMKRLGIEDFEFHLLELSATQLGRARMKIQEEGFQRHFQFFETDLNNWRPNCKFAGAMAHHSLHHIVELEHLFDMVRDNLLGYFCTMDMIGRNGHMRWPEVLELVQAFWDILPPQKRVHQVLPNFEKGFYNHDCSTEGFEGIRAQDILPCLIERFGFEGFYAFGGLTDPFVSRGFGHHYNMSVDWDKSFIDLIAKLNNILICCGYIKPTQLYAVMTTDKSTTPKIFENRTPEFCLRNVK